MKKLADNLALAGQPVDTDDLVSQVLAGLDSLEYDPVLCQLNEKEHVSWMELQSTLLSYERRLKQINGGISSLNIGQTINKSLLKLHQLLSLLKQCTKLRRITHITPQSDMLLKLQTQVTAKIQDNLNLIRIYLLNRQTQSNDKQIAEKHHMQTRAKAGKELTKSHLRVVDRSNVLVQNLNLDFLADGDPINHGRSSVDNIG
ncbi:hypothetical protein LWI29_005449 [Acer saccharum]|uniref:Uncharacterized protein n=1 Tax=Acer saccharum TaxID=4024 RepID=A0AA39SCK9_ACESA|nr:hypothetical protein LWI29_005449 [Acer saccharum]